MFRTNFKLKSILLLMLVLTAISFNMFADCDMMAMITKKGFRLSSIDPRSGSFNDPNDFITWQMNRSFDAAVTTKHNDDGYGILYYKDDGYFYLNPDSLGHSEDNQGDPLNQAWYQKGLDTYYTDGTDNWKWELDKAEEVIMNNNTGAIIVLGHDRQGTGGEGSHPFRFSIEGDDKTYTFQHNGFLDDSFRNDLHSYLTYQDSLWFTDHPLNWDNGVIDSEIFFHYLMSYVIDYDGNILQGIHNAMNETNLHYSSTDSVDVYYELKTNDENNIVNFVLSDGFNIYVFRNAPLSDDEHSIGYYDNLDFYGIRTYGVGNYDDEIDPFELVIFSPYGKTIIPRFIKPNIAYPLMEFVKGNITEDIDFQNVAGYTYYYFYDDVTIPEGSSVSITEDTFIGFAGNVNQNIFGDLTISENAKLSLNHASTININNNGELFLNWGSTITGATPTRWIGEPGHETPIPGDRIICTNGGRITTNDDYQNPGNEIIISSSSGEMWEGIQIKNPRAALTDEDKYWFVNCDISGIKQIIMESDENGDGELYLYSTDFKDGENITVRDGHKLTIHGTEGDYCYLQNNYSGSPIYAYESSVDLDYVWVGGLEEDDDLGNSAGIYLYDISRNTSRIKNCKFKFNRKDGIKTDYITFSEFSNNDIEKNSCFGMLCYDGTTFSGDLPFNSITISNNGFTEYAGWHGTFEMEDPDANITITDDNYGSGYDNYLLINLKWDPTESVDISGTNITNDENLSPENPDPPAIPAWIFSEPGGITGSKELLDSASLDFAAQNYSSARQTLYQLLSEYLDSPEAISAVYYLYHIENLADEDFTGLRDYLTGLNAEENTLIYDTIKKVSAKTLMKEEDYIASIEELEEIIINSELPDEVISAMIDEGYCYLKLYESGDRALPDKCTVKTRTLEEYQAKVRELELQYSFYPNEQEQEPVPQTGNILSLANYPNPFNPKTTISFTLAKGSNVSLDVYNIKGQKVKSLTNSHYDNGTHSVNWNGTDNHNKFVSTGIYFFKLSSGNETKMKKMLLIK